MAQDHLFALAQAVTEGSDIDWAAAESSSEAAEREAVQQLRLVVSIGQAARKLAARWGPLEIRQLIGRGSFGTVYRAWDPRLDREVALKVLHDGTDAVSSEGTVHEARLLATVEHPNIVPVYGADIHNGQVGIWMKFIYGRTLKDILIEHGPFGAAEAALIGRDLCQALAAVHRRGLVHRDVKSQNVMREVGGQVVLMDFGAGQALAAAAADSLKGSPAYLAPEVVAGQPPTPQSDLYSLAVLLYHLATGEFPVVAQSWDDLRARHARRESRSLRDVRPDLPDWFVAAVDRGLASEPQDRPASAGAFSRLLDGPAAQPLARGPSLRDDRSSGITSTRWPVFWWLARPWRMTVVLVMAAIAAAIATWALSRPAPLARTPLVAILPFQSLSADADVGFLAEAVSLELTAKLGHVGALNVVPWSFMKAAEPHSIEEVARETGADLIVDGSVQSLATPGERRRLHVRVQVFRASTGTLFWTTTLDRDLGEFFELQADLARQLAQRIQVILARREQLQIDRVRRTSPEAMELYLKARLAWEGYADDFSVPIELFRRAIQIEPDFAEAYAGLAECFALQHSYSGTVAADEALSRVLEHAGRAIDLDPLLADAWATRAFAKLALAWDWAGAESDYVQARQLSPSSPTVAASYANYLITMRRFDEAIAVSREAADRSPFSPVVSRKLAWAYYVGGRHDEAIAELQRTLQIDPSYGPALTLLARAHALRGSKEEAVRLMQAAMRPGFEALLAQVYAAAGDVEGAQRTLSTILAPTYKGPVLRYQIAAAYAALGDDEEAVRWLQDALTIRDSGISLLPADPMFDKIRNSPRFIAVLDTLKLP